MDAAPLEECLDCVFNQVAALRRGGVEDLPEGSPVMPLVKEKAKWDALVRVALDAGPSVSGVRLGLLAQQPFGRLAE